ncbi:MAG: hypothetical protein WAO23_05615, partial [Dethiobacteria bacterium]
REDVIIYESDWSKYSQIVSYYSSNNSFDFHKIWKVKGYDLFALIGAENLTAGDDCSIFFEASDGVKKFFTVGQLKSLYYSSAFTLQNGALVNPMLGFCRAELFSKEGDQLVPPITWNDQELTEDNIDNDCPRLYMGQEAGNIDDMNQSNFLKKVVRIVVGDERPVDDGGEFADSPFKHITHEGAPYHIDSITGATMTIDGPGTESYRALSLRQIEEENRGLLRETYTELIDGEPVQSVYEGIKVSYLLDNFITLRESAGKVVFKDKNRQMIVAFDLEDIHDESRKMIIAYGIDEVPLVYTYLDAGYIPAKRNDDGCFKFAYLPQEGEPWVVFSNVAYIYIEEDGPGVYEHTDPPYNNPRFTNYILTLTGTGLGKEINYTVEQLEAMADLHLEKEYSLSNSYYYWYYRTYKGVPLWDLLLRAGLDKESIDESLPVNFEAADYYNFPPLTVGEIRNDELYGYYEKDWLDKGDGTFDGRRVEPLKTGYPVLIAYGFNGYPYVTHPQDQGYNSGLGNDGGPLRVIFGKRSYDHTNGSHQVKFARRIIIGEDIRYSTHAYAPYDQLDESPLDITVIGEDGITVKEVSLTVKDMEDMIYDVPAATADSARVKNYFFTKYDGDEKISDLYEGVDLNYLIFEKIGVPGNSGTVVFENEAGDRTLEVSLEEIVRSDYFNEVSGDENLKPVIAFAKNGYPLVKTQNDDGYMGSPIVNCDGPLVALFGQTEAGIPGRSLNNVQKITINISKDPWAHLEEPYDAYADDILTIKGEGLRKEHQVKVSELEFMQNYIFNREYCLAKAEDNKQSDAYRGIDIYEYIRKEIGFTAGAEAVTFKAADGSIKSFGLDEIAGKYYINELTGADNLRVMLAFGKNGKPLVPAKTSEGYETAAGNDGGPLRLLIGQTREGDLNSGKSMRNIVEIEVEATGGDSWKHNHGIYTKYLDESVLRITGSQVKEPRTFSLRQVEAMTEYVIRDIYNGGAGGESEWEGIILWKIIEKAVGLADGVIEPNSVRVFAGPNYNQLLNTRQVIDGVKNSQGVTREIILGYAVGGYPLVPKSSDDGYVNNNEFGPLRLIVEENNSLWTKWVDCIVVGTGNYEKPIAEDIREDEDDPSAPDVFAISVEGMEVPPKGYTPDALRSLKATEGSYKWSSKSGSNTDRCKGVLLADLLADAGFNGPDWQVKVVTTDGFDYRTVSLREIIKQEYLVAYQVNGEVFEDTDKSGGNPSPLRIYRRFNDGEDWQNRLTLISGVSITPCRGDITGKGRVTGHDAILILRHIVGLIDIGEEYGPDALGRARVTGKENPGVNDAILVLRYVVGLIEEFPDELSE